MAGLYTVEYNKTAAYDTHVKVLLGGNVEWEKLERNDVENSLQAVYSFGYF